MDQYTCEETFRRLDDFVDRELSPQEVELVKQHLEVCSVCAAEYRFESSILDHVRETLRHVAVPADLQSKISRLLQEKPAD